MNFKFFIAANQDYKTSSEEEYVILGNDAIVKCKIPSFVADFVSVVSWHDSDDKSFFAAKDYGTIAIIRKDIARQNMFYTF